MEYVNLGSTGLRVSRICLGMMSFGDKSSRKWVLEEDAAAPLVRAAADGGVIFFDTADIYAMGASEVVTGRLLGKLFLPGRRKQIEGEIQPWRFLRELLHTARGRVNALQQRVEGKPLAMRHDDLAVEREAIRLQLQRCGDDLGEIAREVFAGFRAQVNAAAVARQQAAEAIPFRLVLPLLAARDRVDRPRLHRHEGGRLSRALCGRRRQQAGLIIRWTCPINAKRPAFAGRFQKYSCASRIRPRK